MPPVFLKSAGLLVHLHHVIAGVDIAGSNHIHAGKIIGVGNNGDNHRRVARCLDLIQVHRQQQLALGDLAAQLDLGFKACLLYTSELPTIA